MRLFQNYSIFRKIAGMQKRPKKKKSDKVQKMLTDGQHILFVFN